MKTKLIMTMLARDEIDIIEKNICFHLNNGVDFIIAIDNGSKDKTPKIFNKYSKKGVLSFKIIKKHTYEQGKWVSLMAKEAVTKHRATHIFHCDADEFWYPSSGNLKNHLPKGNEVFLVPVINYLPKVNFCSLPICKTTMVVNPYFRYALRENKESYRYFLYNYYPKVLTTSRFTKIAQGNHFVKDKIKQKKIDSKYINIHHFPIRTYKQFKMKVINGGSSYERNPDKNPEMGWHTKEWFYLYKKGLLRDVYNATCLSNEEKNILIENGLIKKVFIPKKIIMAKNIYRLRSIR